MERQIPLKTYINNNTFYLKQDELRRLLSPNPPHQIINGNANANANVYDHDNIENFLNMPLMQNLEQPSLLNTVNIMINMLQNMGGGQMNNIPPLEDVVVPFYLVWQMLQLARLWQRSLFLLLAAEPVPGNCSLIVQQSLPCHSF